MSSADVGALRTPRRVRLRAQAGYTLLEVGVAVILVASMSIILDVAVSSTQKTERYLEAVRTATERGQRLVLELQGLASASRKLFQDDEVGQDYLAALDLARDPRAPGTRLPLFDLGDLGPDGAGEAFVGNMLLFARESDSVPCVTVPLEKRVRNVDTYRFLCVYPHQTESSILHGQPPARDLVIWRSLAFPSHQQLLEIPEGSDQRKNAVLDLYHRHGYRTAWDPGRPVAEAFFRLQPDGKIVKDPEKGFVIREDPQVSERGRLVHARVQLARTDEREHARRTVLGAADEDGWQPDGFEVKIAGASHARQVWIHVVVEAAERGGQRGHSMGFTVIAATRDF